MRCRLLLLILFTLLAESLGAATYPLTRWRQYRTDHFVVIFPRELEVEARGVGPRAEAALARVSPLWDYEPRGPIYLVVKDDQDTFNGAATLIPKRAIIIWLRPPINGQRLWDTGPADPLDLVLTHELTHIAHLDTRGGIFRILYRLFGPAFSPNLYLPPMMIEGFAVETETKMEKGRGLGTLYEMIVRTDLMEGRRRSIDQVVTFNRRFPQGITPYLYGYLFSHYLAETYGDERLTQLSHTTGRRFPYFLNGAFERVYGKSLSVLWDEFLDHLQRKYPPTTPGQEVAKGELIWETGGWAEHLTLDPSGRKLYFYWLGKDNYPSLVSLDLEARRVRRLAKGWFTGRIAVTGDGRLFYAKEEPFHYFSSFHDLYVYDLKKGGERRLTSGERASDVAATPDGRSLVYVRNEKGHLQLMLMDLESGEREEITPPRIIRSWHSPLFVDGGDGLLVLGQDRVGRDTLYRWSREGGKWKEIHRFPTWVASLFTIPGDHSIGYSSSREGVPNLFSYSLRTGAEVQESLVSSGAFFGAVRGRDLYYAIYASDGFEIRKLDLQGGKVVAQTAARSVEPPPDAASGRIQTDAHITRYKPSRQLLLPFTLLPVGGTDESGAQAGIGLLGADILLHHQYQLQALYGIFSRRPSFEGLYIYDRWYPTVTLFGFDGADLYTDRFSNIGGEAEDYWEGIRGGGVELSIPIWKRSRYSLDLKGRYRYERLRSLEGLNLTPVPFTGTMATAGGGVDFSFVEAHLYSISPEKGLILLADADRSDRSLGGDIDRWRLLAQMKSYLPGISRRQVLYLAGQGGLALEERLPQGDFQVGGNINLDLLGVRTDFFPLRGYPTRFLTGSRFFTGQAEYRLPLWFVERGHKHLPWYLDHLSLVPFYDAGTAWTPGGAMPFSDSVGAELRAGLLVAYFLPINLRLGLARGLRDQGITSGYLGVGGFF